MSKFIIRYILLLKCNNALFSLRLRYLHFRISDARFLKNMLHVIIDIILNIIKLSDLILIFNQYVGKCNFHGKMYKIFNYMKSKYILFKSTINEHKVCYVNNQNNRTNNRNVI